MCRVALRLGIPGGGGPPGFRNDVFGVSVKIQRDTLMAVCQLAGISAAALILPCSLIDMSFDTDLLGMLMQATLVGVALALIALVWTDQEE